MGNFRGGGGGGGANCPPGQGGPQPQRRGIAGMFQQLQDRQKPQPTPEMTTGPQVGMRPPDQNGVRTPYDHRAMPPVGPGGGGPGGPGGGRNPMMQRQFAQAQGMRRPPNPGGSRMPMRGGGRGGMRGGGRGMY